MLLLYIINNSGPRREPCGTLLSTCLGALIASLTLTFISRLVRKYSIQERNIPQFQILNSICNKMPCQTIERFTKVEKDKIYSFSLSISYWNIIKGEDYLVRSRAAWTESKLSLWNQVVQLKVISYMLHYELLKHLTRNWRKTFRAVIQRNSTMRFLVK